MVCILIFFLADVFCASSSPLLPVANDVGKQLSKGYVSKYINEQNFLQKLVHKRTSSYEVAAVATENDELLNLFNDILRRNIAREKVLAKNVSDALAVKVAKSYNLKEVEDNARVLKPIAKDASECLIRAQTAAETAQTQLDITVVAATDAVAKRVTAASSLQIAKDNLEKAEPIAQVANDNFDAVSKQVTAAQTEWDNAVEVYNTFVDVQNAQLPQLEKDALVLANPPLASLKDTYDELLRANVAQRKVLAENVANALDEKNGRQTSWETANRSLKNLEPIRDNANDNLEEAEKAVGTAQTQFNNAVVTATDAVALNVSDTSKLEVANDNLGKVEPMAQYANDNLKTALTIVLAATKEYDYAVATHDTISALQEAELPKLNAEATKLRAAITRWSTDIKSLLRTVSLTAATTKNDEILALLNDILRRNLAFEKALVQNASDALDVKGAKTYNWEQVTRRVQELKPIAVAADDNLRNARAAAGTAEAAFDTAVVVAFDAVAKRVTAASSLQIAKDNLEKAKPIAQAANDNFDAVVKSVTAARTELDKALVVYDTFVNVQNAELPQLEKDALVLANPPLPSLKDVYAELLRANVAQRKLLAENVANALDEKNGREISWETADLGRKNLEPSRNTANRNLKEAEKAVGTTETNFNDAVVTATDAVAVKVRASSSLRIAEDNLGQAKPIAQAANDNLETAQSALQQAKLELDSAVAAHDTISAVLEAEQPDLKAEATKLRTAIDVWSTELVY